MSNQTVYLEARNVSIAFPAPNLSKMNGPAIGGRIVRNGKRLELLAVDDATFHVNAGESLAILGQNGSGKTTLLRMLAGILQPTSGSVNHRGSLGNALNTSLGFRAEATGRHNIKLKALIAGQKHKDIPAVIADVEEFSELGVFLDMPLHTYSAGMRARLAFGIATAFKYDILILDEWLGAGDRRMIAKVQSRMQEFVDSSAITVLASHSLRLLKSVCTHGIVMDKGRIVAKDTIEEAISAYLELDTQLAEKLRKSGKIPR